MLRLRSAAAAIIAASVLLAGCATSEHDQVQSKVRQFLQATAHHEYRTLCTQVLARSLLAHLATYGLPCEKAMQIGLGKVKNPALAIGRIDIHGKTASVITITTAQGQEASLDAIELIDSPGGWRVTSLGTPQFPK